MNTVEDPAGLALRLLLSLPTLAVGIAAVAVALHARRRKPRSAALFAAGVAVTVGWVGLEFAAYDWPDLNGILMNNGMEWNVAFTLFWGAEQVAHTLALLLFAAAFLVERG